MIRITCKDGNLVNAKITTDKGIEVQGVTALSIDMAPNRPINASAKMLVESIDVMGEAKFLAVHPKTGEDIEIAGFVLTDGEQVII